jgi:hypothetical protein
MGRHRLDHEMRDQIMLFRVTRNEQNEFYQWARSHRMSMSYFIRAALEKSYPTIFKNPNRHIRKPRKQRPMPIPALISTSLVNQKISVRPALTQPQQG